MSDVTPDRSIDDRALNVYLNDHLAGATFGADLARQLEGQMEGSAFHAEMSRLATDIEADLDTLKDLMQRLDVPRNPGKRAVAWSPRRPVASSSPG